MTLLARSVFFLLFCRCLCRAFFLKVNFKFFLFGQSFSQFSFICFSIVQFIEFNGFCYNSICINGIFWSLPFTYSRRELFSNSNWISFLLWWNRLLIFCCCHLLFCFFFLTEAFMTLNKFLIKCLTDLSLVEHCRDQSTPFCRLNSLIFMSFECQCC